MAEAEARTHMRPWPTHTWTTISTSTYLLLLLLNYSSYYNNNNNNCYQQPNCSWCYFYCSTIKISYKYCCYWLYYMFNCYNYGHALLNCTYATLQPNKLLIVLLCWYLAHPIHNVNHFTHTQSTNICNELLPPSMKKTATITIILDPYLQPKF